MEFPVNANNIVAEVTSATVARALLYAHICSWSGRLQSFQTSNYALRDALGSRERPSSKLPF